MSARRFVLPEVDDTRALGTALGGVLRAGDLVVLTGGSAPGRPPSPRASARPSGCGVR